ncbi:antibiotic biosynthesis monooxygenase [Parafrankia colletiae]|uniref:Antibiotic biosynthesis monooxygenase n=1 Tax=Parafrankia colletiae TaxID=573497 RepID=A0A1S1Q6T1_9ACTN|nr:antibiotic biosynthesis monooxygenase [Parafrankia colletiae]MCK9903718.1 antibiotic biosynthesis monooxygenase [Frankia sp. Cpl3]OHV30598.1 antibiotic biosynthesis monooxygenase [Parafrankia colletiae]
MSVVKINVLTVPPAMRETLESRFAGRAGMVEKADGFEWFELLRPLEGTDTYLVYTRWRSEEDFQKWQSSMAFSEGHRAAGAEAAPGAHGHPGGAPTGAPAGNGASGGHGGQPGHGGPAASGATLWSFEVVQSAAPAAG